jgi:hypothetical protein
MEIEDSGDMRDLISVSQEGCVGLAPRMHSSACSLSNSRSINFYLLPLPAGKVVKEETIYTDAIR